MININVNSTIEGKFNKLLRLYNENYDDLINGMVEYKKNELKKGIRNIENDFRYYEKKYALLTEDFYNKFINGDFKEHNNDYLIWSGEYEVWKEFKDELKQIS